MQYEQALAFIHGIERFGCKPGLTRVSLLLERMGNPQNSLKFIHVAGTNGKGSTCAMLSSILVQAGYKTGLYISPFVVDFCERIQINNEMIPHEELAASTALVKKHWDALAEMGEPPTEFEVVVAVAMDYFMRQSCDVVVLEVGMGGRFDATNVIRPPLVSVITSISLDHVEYLGDTLAKIAFEKCGIIKEGSVTVSYPDQPAEAQEVIMQQCAEKQNRLLMGSHAKVLASGLLGSDILYDGQELHVPFAGEHQVYNTIAVLEAIGVLCEKGFAISNLHVQNGIAAAKMPARLEVLSQKPLVLLDGAHNTSGMQALAKTLALVQNRRFHAVIGMMRDKDVESMVKIIAPYCVSIVTVEPANPRAMPAGDLARIAMRYCDQVYISGNCGASFIQALAHCSGDDAILICGSLYLASQIRQMAQKVLAQIK